MWFQAIEDHVRQLAKEESEKVGSVGDMKLSWIQLASWAPEPILLKAVWERRSDARLSGLDLLFSAACKRPIVVRCEEKYADNDFEYRHVILPKERHGVEIFGLS